MADPDSRSDEDLLRATRAEPEAFGVFYRRHQRGVGAYFMRRTRDAELAADLTAETFATALIGAGRYTPTGPAVGWLFGIARNLLLRSIEHRRVEDRARRRLGLRVEITDDVLEHFERLAGDESAEMLLSDLAADQAAAVRARVIDGATYGEIAARLQCSESVVRQRVSRGLTSLRSREDLT